MIYVHFGAYRVSSSLSGLMTIGVLTKPTVGRATELMRMAYGIYSAVEYLVFKKNVIFPTTVSFFFLR